MASAICPQCRILLVEASSSSMANLGTGVNTAVRLGANVVSNSYGGSDYPTETTDEGAYFNHPGVAITVSSGDNGYGVEFPAASRYVTAVGGTSVAAPIVASVYALSGNAGSVTYGSYSYAHLGSLFDVTSGSDGSCGGTYLCTAVAGYDGPTGNGTPNGLGAF